MNTLQKYMLFLLFCIPITFWAQTTVSGVVTESATGMPIPGANVVIPGTTTGTTTDFDGKYQINANDGEMLEFSYIGFITQTVKVTSSTINVALVEDTQQLDEVIVVGYGSEKKTEITGSVNKISTEDFNKGPIVSADQLITGKIAGVAVTSGGGAPGESQSIIIRGNGSLSLSSSPLIVVDGIPLDNGSVGGSRNVLDFINPNDIESMTVLKDASSTAIYGSRAANGVIMITTKKGKGKEFKFNYNGSTTLYKPTNYVDVMNADQFRTFVNANGTDAQIALLGNSNTNWQEEIYTEAVGYEHSLSAMGNIKGFMPVRASIAYSNHDGILRTDNFNRTTASLNLRPYLFDDHLKIELNGRAMYTENRFANRGAIGSAVDFDPTQSIYGGPDDVANYWGWYDIQNGETVQNNLAQTNPLALLNLYRDTAEVRRFIGSAKFDYKLHFLPNVTATVNVGLDKSNAHGRNITSPLMPSSQLDWSGALNSYINRTTNSLFDGYLTYTGEADKHSLTAVAGYSYQKFEYDNFSYDGQREQDGLIAKFIDKSRNVLLSYFGRATYSYDDRYVLKVTFRADASSVLNPNDRWGYFPATSVAWNIDNENFLENSKTFSTLRLRAGYGEIGNVNGLAPYQFLQNYSISQDTANYQLGVDANGDPVYYNTYRPDAYNEDLRWEIGKTLDVGLDFGLFNERVSGSVSAYLKKTEDLISYVNVSPFTNFSNGINDNIGDMENRGIELELNVTPVQTENFTWSFGYNLAFNDNEITSLPVPVDTGGINGGTGNQIQIHQEGYAPFSYYVYKQVYDTNGNPIEGAYVDRNGDNIINDDDRYIYKDPYADIIMGFNTNLNYKNWDLSVVTRANIGNYAYNNMASAKSHTIRATENNILTNLHTDYYNTQFTSLTDQGLLSDYYIQEASFFKVDNITLGYSLKEAIKGIDKMRFYGSVQNVATITDYDGLDPEISGGIDNNFYPRPTSFVFGVNVDF
ncbi:SusC/RagA family TonB-linked outer membrane protein [Neptunitalea lumnitzerae]|nr:SusC/RagA family TonB-linked outer membrane protein [Neptunitalea sp. Y10]